MSPWNGQDWHEGAARLRKLGKRSHAVGSQGWTEDRCPTLRWWEGGLDLVRVERRHGEHRDATNQKRRKSQHKIAVNRPVLVSWD